MVTALLALRMALLSIVPQPAVAKAIDLNGVKSIPTSVAAEQWLGQPETGYNLAVTSSRQQDAERATTSARTTIARERTAVVPSVSILSRERVETLIDEKAAKYQVSAATMRGIIKCESGYNQLAKNKRSSAAGFAQFIDGTWKSALRALGYDQSITQYDGEKNIEALAFVLSTQGTRPWNASRSCWSR